MIRQIILENPFAVIGAVIAGIAAAVSWGVICYIFQCGIAFAFFGGFGVGFLSSQIGLSIGALFD